MLFKHPSEDTQSVSYTLLIVSFFLLVGVGIAQVLGKVNSVGPFQDLFFTTTALYFGRRFSVNGKTFSSDPVNKETNES